MYYFFFSFLLMSCSDVEPESYILPDNFRGRVIILMNQKDGEVRQYKKGRRIYNIPENGILKTKFKTNTGSSAIDAIKFYLKDKYGKEIEIPDFNIRRDSMLTGCQVFYYGNGVLGDKNIDYVDFLVTPYQERNAYFRQNKDGILIEDNSIWHKVDSTLRH